MVNLTESEKQELELYRAFHSFVENLLSEAKTVPFKKWVALFSKDIGGLLVGKSPNLESIIKKATDKLPKTAQKIKEDPRLFEKFSEILNNKQ